MRNTTGASRQRLKSLDPHPEKQSPGSSRE
jgi:hypothetical protein